MEESWDVIAEKLKISGMKQVDIESTKKQADAIHSLDKLVFGTDLPFNFLPTKVTSHSASYYDRRYHLYVDGMNSNILKPINELKKSWPEYTHKYINPELIFYSFGAEIVRIRAQEELDIGLFTPEHAGKITKIPLLNDIVKACSRPEIKTPSRFDAQVIGTYASYMVYESRRDGKPMEDFLWLISELVKLDAKTV